MKFYFIIISLLFYFFSYSQTNANYKNHIIDSKVFKEKRTISVYLPKAYFSDIKDQKFVVAYLFDGQFEPYFSMVNSIMSYYEQTNEGIPMIVVGIHTEERWEEFVPTCTEEIHIEKIKGADLLTLFLKNEVIPLIDSTYRTTDFRVGIGHSLGGTYVINEIIKNNALFNAVIAASPNLTMCNEQINKDAAQFFANDSLNQRFIYTAVGTEGKMENDFRKSVVKLDSISKTFTLEHVYWKFKTLEDQNHMTTFVPTFNDGYLYLSSKFILVDENLGRMADNKSTSMSQAIITFYSELENFSKIKQNLGSELLLEYIKKLMQLKKFEDCVELCKYVNQIIEGENLAIDQKEKTNKSIKNCLAYSEFNLIANEAQILGKEGKYSEAGQLYIKAFKMDVKNGTPGVRIKSVPILAKAGLYDLAFEQLDLLANYFVLGGNEAFMEDSLCESLHSDKRWKKYMEKLAKNANKYN